LSLPTVLNASIITKIRYQETNGDDKSGGTNKGELQFPDEGSLLIGGRAGDHIGFLLEVQLIDPEGSNWASFKMPITYEVSGVNLSVIPFTTDAGGPAYGFELLNTGAMRMQRVLEHRKETSAQQYINTAREATGLAFAVSHPLFFATYTFWSPEHGTTDASPYLHYARAALTPTFGSWDLGFGGQFWNGNTNFSVTETVLTAPVAGGQVTSDEITSIERVSAEAWALDAQAQGAILGRPLGIYLTYAEADSSDPERPNLFNPNTMGDREAFTALAELGVIPQRLTISAAFRDGDTGSSANSEQKAITGGIIFMLTQNVELQINHTRFGGNYYDLRKNDEDQTGDTLTTLMIFAAF
ncbi:MAG: hypothetical protein HY880_09640, partial [Deltaproteobacteria bacterium]|nr:hypothetical protein [Deltaproteobacteria bacterium]